MKLFVTGGTGVLGREVVPRLVAAGHDVRALARRPEAADGLRETGAEPVAVDLFDAAGVDRAVEGVEAILHLATHIPPLRSSGRRSAWATNDRLRTEATAHLAAAARRHGISRVVKESITFIYADGGDEWLDEDAPLGHYPRLASTVAGERTVLELAGDGVVPVVLRFGLFYGGTGNRSTDELLQLARYGRSMVAGSPRAYLSTIHVADAATAVVAALGAPSGIWNVADDEPLRRQDALDAFSAAFGLRRVRPTPGWVVRLMGGRSAGALTASQRASNGRFRAATGWSPRFPSVREGWPEVARSSGRGPNAARTGVDEVDEVVGDA